MVNKSDECSLQRARRVGEEAAKIGFDWPSAEGALAKVSEEVEELRETFAEEDGGRRRKRQEEELGDLFFSVVNVARHLDIDPVVALSGAIARFEARFLRVGSLAKEREEELEELTIDELEALWQQAKRELNQGKG